MLSIPLTVCERELFERAARWPGNHCWFELTPLVLQRVASEEGIEFATALLYDRVRRSPEHGSFIEQVEALPEHGAANLRDLDATLVLVPGAFYVERPDTGADGRVLLEQAAQYGFRTARVPIHSFGTPSDNARTLRDWLGQLPNENVVLVSLSKGGAEVKLALALPGADAAFRRVKIWVDLCGLLHGTPIVSWLFARRFRTFLVRILFWYRGHPFAALHELVRGSGALLDFPLRYPEMLKIVHVVGFPLARHLTCPLAQRGYRRIAHLGPNDGGANVLADICTLPGLIYPVWGADHYLRPAWDIRRLTGRLLQFVAAEL